MIRVLATLAAMSTLAFAPTARADTATANTAAPWCAPEVEELSDGVCHIDGGPKADHGTLVVFLHGMIAKGTTWQWTQERALLRQAREAGVEAIFPRAPLGSSAYAWPGSVKAQEAVEGELIAGWRAAQSKLEERAGRPFGRVFVMGFSSGAYFASSLALRGSLDVDGYAVFAGGAAYSPRPDHPPRVTPVFVGVCADDAQTAGDSRSLGAALTTRGWPHRVDEQPVGHMFSDVHVVRAVSYLKAASRSRR